METDGSSRIRKLLGPVLLDSASIQKRVLELGAQITTDYKYQSPLMVVILKGAAIFHADLIRCIQLDLSYDFMAVGSYGDSTVSSGEVPCEVKHYADSARLRWSAIETAIMQVVSAMLVLRANDGYIFAAIGHSDARYRYEIEVIRLAA